MDIAALLLVVAAIFAWGVISARAAVISAPIFFVAIGLLMAEGLRLDRPPAGSPYDQDHRRGYACLGAIRRRQPRTILRPARGSAVLRPAPCHRFAADDRIGNGRRRHHPGPQPVVCAACGRRMAPTDAALGSAVMSDRRVPYRVRQTLNVESGLNDGIATPIVTVALAAIAAQVGLGHEGLGHGLTGLVLGALTGAVLGASGGMLLRSAGRRGLGSEEFAGPSVLALALLAYLCATLIRCKWFRRRLRGRKRIRRFRWPGRGAGGLLRRADLRSRVDDLLAAFRSRSVFRRSPRAGAGESSSTPC